MQHREGTLEVLHSMCEEMGGWLGWAMQGGAGGCSVNLGTSVQCQNIQNAEGCFSTQKNKFTRVQRKRNTVTENTRQICDSSTNQQSRTGRWMGVWRQASIHALKVSSSTL